MIKTIERSLKEYREKKAKVEIALSRIEAWEYALNHLDEVSFITNKSKPNDCWIMKFNKNGYTGGSLVETLAITDSEKTHKLRELIANESSRIFPYRLEVNQIEKALEALTKQEKYIIECKYFEKMFWREIEINFNNQFRQQNYITESGIRKIKGEAVQKLTEILRPFYESFKVA